MGGGMMRTAAKAVAAGGFRVAHAPRIDLAAAAGARRSARPPPSAVAVPGQVAEGAPLLYAASSNRSAPIEGWEVVVRDEEELFDALQPAPPARLVFGPVPTLEEAKEATSDLKDAVEKLYFTPTASGLESFSVAAKSVLPESSCLESMDAKNKCVAIIPSMPRHVVQAFSLLQGCPEAQVIILLLTFLRWSVAAHELILDFGEFVSLRARRGKEMKTMVICFPVKELVSDPRPLVQDVVASLASDKSVWDAVMKNEKVMEFYKTHQINSPPVETSRYQEESVSEDGKCTDSSVVEEAPPSSQNGFTGFVKSIKVKVTEVVNGLSDFFSDLFKDLMGTTETKEATASEGSHFNMGVGASFFALAVAAILVILVRRG
ncbi:hypothetical protein Taro_030418 [Colocasia esculenta]|uniref:Uncharacterized protein n=1 Tax=Colocasia esculenta TaxID=4460 RepID=A0A843VTZ7_COLES|nr:hypothetical protein [Colocasia esculenta]